MILLVYFILIAMFLITKKNKSIAFVLVLIHIVSLTGTLFVDGGYPVDTIFKGCNLIFTAFILTLILLPWMKHKNIQNITVQSDIKVKRLTFITLAVSLIPFITFIAVSAYVLVTVDDINTFKYAQGVATDFYYSMPINVKLYILSNHIFHLSYFLIPLHFYYLSRRKYILSIFCFLLSLNIMLHGLTFFSRAIIVQYILIYLSFLYLLFNTLNKKIKRYVKLSVITLGIMFVGYFAHITNERFTKDNIYAENIPPTSLIQEPVIYSYFDYLSQWYYNGMYVLNSYGFETFNGQISFQPALSLLNHFRLLDYDATAYARLRKELWPSNWDSFNGLVAYSVYDYGYFLTTILSLFYCFLVVKLAPVGNTIPLINLFVIAIVIQLPLMAIFYSNVGGVLFPFFFLIPIYLFLRIKWT